jgi:sugar lactone lactonase YvrE
MKGNNMQVWKKLVWLAAVLPCSVAMAAPQDTSDAGGTTAGSVEVVARFDAPDPSGIAVTPDGRIFIGFPRHADDHSGPTLGELKNGKLVPYPDVAHSMPSAAPASERLVSVHGMTLDAQGRLWLIDDGKRAGHPIPDGAAKVVGIDPATNRIVANVVLRAPALLADSHMNDLRIDLTHGSAGTAYISDSSFGTSPALVVVDLASGRQRRVLAQHPSTRAEAGFMAVIEGKPLRYDPKDQQFPVGGVDGVTLSADSSRLYFAPLTSRRLYSIPTAILADFTASDNSLAAAVKDEGEKGFADGLATDAAGRIYTTDAEHDQVLRRNLDGSFDVAARDPRFLSPDGIFAARDYIYLTLGQWNRLASFHHGANLRRPPFLLVRFPVADAPRIDVHGAP